MKELYWIAVDWGSSNLRVWALDKRHKILDSFSSSDGMLSLEIVEFEPLLLEKISNWVAGDVNIPVLCCGRVGAKQGWLEAPYARAPYNVKHDTDCVKVGCWDKRLVVRILGGLQKNTPAHVM